MKKLILDLYQQIEKEQIKNNKFSKYWIFHVESILLKENGISKRYLKVLFFNRMMNEHNNLMRLYLNVNGKNIEKDDFVVSTEYHDANVMGFILELDLIDEAKDITIDTYVIDGKKQDLPLEYRVGFKFYDNARKYQALKNFTNTLTDDMITVPYFDHDKWVCGCGYTNHVDNTICPICASKKDQMKELHDEELKNIILPHCSEGLKLNINQPYHETVYQYVKEIEEKYDINMDELLTCFDMDTLETEQKRMVDEYIKNYLQENPIKLNNFNSFEDCLADYYEGICNNVITTDLIESKLDLMQLKQEYETAKSQQVQHSKKRKKIVYLSVVGIGLIGVLITSYQIYKRINRTYEGIEILDTYENRKSMCEGSNEYSGVSNSEMKSIMKENAYCYIDYSYRDIPRVIVKKDENDIIRPLDDNHVLVQHKEFVDESVEKTVRYIADLNGKIVYGDIDKNYTLTTYKNGKIDHEDIYYNGILRGKNVFNYDDENDKFYTITQYSDWIKDGSGICDKIRVENSRIVEIKNDSFHNINTYEGEEIVSTKVLYNDYWGEELQIEEQQIEYVNGLPLVRYYPDGQKLVYMYDNNGFLIQRSFYDSQGSLSMGVNYFYDFEQGTVNEYEWYSEQGIIIPEDINTWKIDFYISSDIDFEHVATFYPVYEDVEGLKANEMN